MENGIFKKCPNCGEAFTLERVLEDAELRPTGMTVEDGDFDLTLYHFDHAIDRCNTSIAIPVKKFLHLIDEELPPELLFGGPACEGHCTQMRELAVCAQECRAAPLRRFLLRIKSRKEAKALAQKVVSQT